MKPLFFFLARWAVSFIYEVGLFILSFFIVLSSSSGNLLDGQPLSMGIGEWILLLGLPIAGSTFIFFYLRHRMPIWSDSNMDLMVGFMLAAIPSVFIALF